MLKISTILLLLTCLGSLCYAQETLRFMDLGFSDDQLVELPFRDDFVIEDRFQSVNLYNRFDLAGYKPVKIDEYHIISSHQPNTPFDIVYVVDEEGNTVGRTMSVTAPQNFFPGGMANYDSNNPHGSPDIESALISGVLATIFRRGIGVKK